MRNVLKYLDITILFIAAALVIMNIIQVATGGDFVEDMSQLLLMIIVLLIAYKAYRG